MEQFEQAALCFQESTNVADQIYKKQDPERLRAIGNAATSLNLAESFDKSNNYFQKFWKDTRKPHSLPEIEVIQYLMEYLSVLKKTNEIRAQIKILNQIYMLACETEVYNFKELTDLFLTLARELDGINEVKPAEALYCNFSMRKNCSQRLINPLYYIN